MNKIFEEMESNKLDQDLARLVAMHRLAESRKEKVIAGYLKEIAIKFVAFSMFYIGQDSEVQAVALKEADRIFNDAVKEYQQHINDITERAMDRLMEDKTFMPDLISLVMQCIK